MSINDDDTIVLKEPVKKVKSIAADIKSVDVIIPDKVVQIMFNDGTKEKAVCDSQDKFELETAISICISKKIMGGSREYHKAIKNGMKIYKNQVAEKEREDAEKEKLKRENEKKIKKAEKRKKKKLEEQIEIQVEAYMRALKRLSEDPKRISL